jgi:hypothetical protein
MSLNWGHGTELAFRKFLMNESNDDGGGGVLKGKRTLLRIFNIYFVIRHTTSIRSVIRDLDRLQQQKSSSPKIQVKFKNLIFVFL